MRLTEEQRKLAEDNYGLVKFLLDQTYSKRTLRKHGNDLLSVGHFALITAARKFCPEKGYKFSTFLKLILLGAVRDHMRTLNTGLNRVMEEMPEGPITDHRPSYTVIVDARLDCDSLLQMAVLKWGFSEEEVALIRLRHAQGFDFSHLSELVGLSENAVRVRIHRDLTRLNRLVEGGVWGAN